MYTPGVVSLTVSAGTAPGTLNATMQFTAQDGTLGDSVTLQTLKSGDFGAIGLLFEGDMPPAPPPPPPPGGTTPPPPSPSLMSVKVPLPAPHPVK